YAVAERGGDSHVIGRAAAVVRRPNENSIGINLGQPRGGKGTNIDPGRVIARHVVVGTETAIVLEAGDGWGTGWGGVDGHGEGCRRRRGIAHRIRGLGSDVVGTVGQGRGDGDAGARVVCCRASPDERVVAVDRHGAARAGSSLEGRRGDLGEVVVIGARGV